MFNKHTDAVGDGVTPEQNWERSSAERSAVDILDFFPFPEIRPSQERALREAVNAFENEGKQYVVLEGPCGSGKSAILYTLAHYFGTAHFLTPLKILQTQYTGDFPGEISDIRGKGNYECPMDREILEQQTKLLKKKGREPERTWVHSCARGPCVTKKRFRKDKKICQIKETILSDDEIVSFDNNHTVLFQTGKVVKYTGCPAQVARMLARQAPIVCHNFDSFLYQNMREASAWKARPLLCVDEAHNTEGKLVKFMEVVVPESELMQGDVLEDMKSVKDFVRYFTEDKPYSYTDMMQCFDHNQEVFCTSNEAPSPHSGYTRARFFWAKMVHFKSKEEFREAEKASEICDKITRIVQYVKFAEANNIDCEYVFDLEERRNGDIVLRCTPLYASLFGQNIFKFGQRIVMASATILNHKVFCRSVGIPLAKAHFIRLDSDFPKENRVIKKEFIGAMSRKDIEKTLPKLIEKIDNLFQRHKNEKGLIHTHTFAITDAIVDTLQSKYPDRILWVGRFRDQYGFKAKDAMLDYHNESPLPTVIVDPSCDQGVDLPDDLCRWQVIAKIPFAMMNKWVQKRMKAKGGEEWYALQTALKFVQSYGRGNRHKDDKCVHYILDSNFSMFERQCRRFNLIPQWIWQGIERKVFTVGSK